MASVGQDVSLILHGVCTDAGGLDEYLVLLRGTPPPTAATATAAAASRGARRGGGNDAADAADAADGAAGAGAYRPLMAALMQAGPDYT